MKIYAIVAGILALCGLLAYGAHIKKRADAADAAEHALSNYKVSVTARDAQEAKDRAAATVRSAALASNLSTLEERVDALRKQTPKEVIRYVSVQGKPESVPADCQRVRLDPEFVSVYDRASDASSGPVPGTN